MQKKKSPHPEWALAQKRKGTELRRIRGRYYLYRVSSKWDPAIKRTRKITHELLGSVTEEHGFVESEKARLRRRQDLAGKVEVKEFGVAAALEATFAKELAALREHFPAEYPTLAALLHGRIAHRAPLKNMAHIHGQSFLSELHPGADLHPKALGAFLRKLGSERSRIVGFCRSFAAPGDSIVFDGTDIPSASKGMTLPRLSRTKAGTYDDMLNALWVFSTKRQEPLFYRLLPGNIKDVSAFRLTLLESGTEDAVVIADKAFASAANIKELEEDSLRYILPLRRDSKLIDYSPLCAADKSLLEGYFKHEDRWIWHYSRPAGKGRTLHTYLDEELRNSEERDCLNRTEPAKIKPTPAELAKKQLEFGTISLLTNTAKTPQETYADYKTRASVETMIDSLKNVLDADRTYMHNDAALEGWMFVNLLALKWHYALLKLLKANNLNSKYSPADLLLFLSSVRKLKINGEWHLAETTKKTRDLLEKLDITPVTYFMKS
jgi:hypothetical protein